MTQRFVVAISLAVAVIGFVSYAPLYGQVDQTDATSPSTMTECEGIDNCATWTFLGVQGTGQWRSGEVANLYFQSVKVIDDNSVAVVIHRADSVGSAAGLTAVYTGIWRAREGRVGGEFTSSWPGHWKNKSANWYAMTEAPLSLPGIMHICNHDYCYTYMREEGHYVNYTNLPYQSNERRVLTVKSFTRNSIVFDETDTGSYPLTSLWTGRVSNDNSNFATGTVVITSWAGKPTHNSPLAPFRLSWGNSLDFLPGDGAESGRNAPPPQARPITGEDALNALNWFKFFKGVADLLGGD